MKNNECNMICLDERIYLDWLKYSFNLSLEGQFMIEWGSLSLNLELFAIKKKEIRSFSLILLAFIG